MNVPYDIQKWLTSSSTGFGQVGAGSTALTVYINKKPASTGNFSVIYQYGGMAPEPICDGSIDNPRIQILTLSAATSDSGYYTAHFVSNRLRRVVNRWIPSSTGDYFISIDPLQSPEPIGEDANGRMQWIQNFQVVVSYS